MRPWQIIVLIALVTAGLASAVASHEPFEDRLVRLEAQRALPALEASLKQESPEINALLLSYSSDQALWMSASLAMLRHGDIARDVLVEFGLSPQFQQVLVRFGADAVLPISYFSRHDVATLRAQHWLGERYQQLSRWWSDEEGGAGSAFTPYRRGQMGIALLDANGHALLNQFVVSEQDEVEWLQGERVVAGVGDFFTSGLRDLESQWRRGDAIDAADLAGPVSIYWSWPAPLRCCGRVGLLVLRGWGALKPGNSRWLGSRRFSYQRSLRDTAACGQSRCGCRHRLCGDSPPKPSQCVGRQPFDLARLAGMVGSVSYLANRATADAGSGAICLSLAAYACAVAVSAVDAGMY